MKRVNLFCLPYAGANKFCFQNFANLVPSSINLILLEYPGRGTRSDEPLLLDTKSLVEDLYKQICSHPMSEYSFYGHSMGGLLAYLLARRICNETPHLKPSHLFISGTPGPSIRSGAGGGMHLLDDVTFKMELKSLNMVPESIFDHAELYEFFEPIIRADFQVCETYQYEKSQPLDIPITVMTGSAELMRENEILLWQNESTSKVDFRVLPGGHFFINERPEIVIDIIAHKLCSSTIHQVDSAFDKNQVCS